MCPTYIKLKLTSFVHNLVVISIQIAFCFKIQPNIAGEGEREEVTTTKFISAGGVE